MSDQPQFSASSFIPGQKVGRYEIRRLLERGGAGLVYRAFDPELNQEVAIKAFHAPTGMNETAFRQTMQAVAGLRHPNLVRLYDFGISSGLYYAVTEMIDVPSLRDFLSERRGGLPRDLAVKIFRQLGDAVAYAHQQGIVHGGIRPSSILMDMGDRPVLADFGLAQLAGQSRPVSNAVDAAYVAPEQVDGQAITVGTDVYALGVILYEMISGDVPFKGENAEAVFAQHLQAASPSPRQLVADLDPRTEETILKALAKKPAERFASARDMIGALSAKAAAGQYDTFALPKGSAQELQKRKQEALAAREAGTKPSAPEPASTPAGSGSSSRMIALAIAAVVIVVVIVLVILLLSGQGVPG